MIEVALARYLHGLSIVTFDETGATGDCFVATMPSTPDVAVMVTPTGGLPQLSRQPTDLPTVQFLVRGPRHDPRPPLARARRIIGALTCLDLVWLDQGGTAETFVNSCTAMQSDPISLGQDDNQRHEWAVNFALRTHSPTAHRPAYA